MITFFKKLSIVLFSILIFSFSTNKTYAAYIANYNIPTDYKNVGSPQNLIRESNGDIWYADSGNYRIVKINSSGHILRKVGRRGNNEGEFNGNVRALTQDDNRNLYVLYNNCQIDKLDSNGGFLQRWVKCKSGSSYFTGIHFDTYSKSILVSDSEDDRQTEVIVEFDKNGNQLSTFGAIGDGEGQFYLPAAITNDSNGNIFVTDLGDDGNSLHFGHRVVIFKPDHTPKFSFDTYIDNNKEYLFPDSIDVLGDGNIVVASGNKSYVRLYSPTGEFIRDLITNGNGNAQSNYPEGLAHDSSNNIYFGDISLNRLQAVNENGDFIWKWGNSGTDPGHFSYPTSIAYDSENNLYVLSGGTDGTGLVQKFTNSGNYISTVISGVLPHGQKGMAIHNGKIYLATDGSVEVYTTSGVYVTSIGSQGSGDGQFDVAFYIAFDSVGDMYVTDNRNNRVEVFDDSGNYLRQWSTNVNGTAANPEAIYIDTNDHVWVAVDTDSYSDPPHYHQIEEYSTTGTVIHSFSTTGQNNTDNMEYVNGLYVDVSTGNIYFSDSGNKNTVTVLSSDGTWQYDIGSWGSGIDQFNQPGQILKNPVMNTLTINDSHNHRIVDYAIGVKIQNLIPSTDIVRITDDFSLTSNYISAGEEGINNINSRMKFGSYLVAAFDVDLSINRNWAAVNAIALPDSSKALVVNLNPTDAPGISSTHSLYLVKQDGQTSVRVCPNATTMEDISIDCDGGFTLNEGDNNLSIVTVSGVSYWKIDGLTGTGAMSEIINSPTVTPAVTPQLGNSSPSSGTSNGGAPVCSDSKPLFKPDLFQININNTTAKLFFTPLAETSKFYISFSEKPIAEDYGAQVTLAREGVQNFTVNLLKPNTIYYFKIRGQNGCMPGDWSNVIEVKTRAAKTKTVTSYYKNMLVKFASGISALFKSPVSIDKNLTTFQTLAPNIQTSDSTLATPPAPKPTVVSPKPKQCILWWCW